MATAHEHGDCDREENESSDHSHNHGNIGELRRLSRTSLMTVALLTGSFMILEAGIGWMTHSLAILADAGHMLGDVAAILLALIANWFASRPASEAKTYGYYRSEILASTLNSLAMLFTSGFIMIESITRLIHPQQLAPAPMIVTGIVGGIINLLCMRILSKGVDHSLNAKAAYLEVLSDLLASASVVVAGVVIHFTGFDRIDSIVSFLIAIALLPRTWSLLSQCVHILMEGTPDHLTISELRTAITALSGVLEIHDLHVWTITSNMTALSGHVRIDESVDPAGVLKAISEMLDTKFGITHSTIQIEAASCAQTSCS